MEAEDIIKQKFISDLKLDKEALNFDTNEVNTHYSTEFLAKLMTKLAALPEKIQSNPYLV